MADSLLPQIAGMCAKGGAFVSEKQAAYFAKRFGSAVEWIESYTFGEFNGCRRSVHYIATFDAQGFVRVTKGTELMFERGGVNQYAVKAAARRASIEANKARETERLTAALAEREAEAAKMSADVSKSRDIFAAKKEQGLIDAEDFEFIMNHLTAKETEALAHIERIKGELAAVALW